MNTAFCPQYYVIPAYWRIVCTPDCREDAASSRSKPLSVLTSKNSLLSIFLATSRDASGGLVGEATLNEDSHYLAAQPPAELTTALGRSEGRKISSHLGTRGKGRSFQPVGTSEDGPNYDLPYFFSCLAFFFF